MRTNQECLVKITEEVDMLLGIYKGMVSLCEDKTAISCQLTKISERLNSVIKESKQHMKIREL